jgi:hypothetical protein
MATILLASAALRAEPPGREIIPEDDHAKQTSWQQTMLEARRRVRNSATQVDLMTDRDCATATRINSAASFSASVDNPRLFLRCCSYW